MDARVDVDDGRIAVRVCAARRRPGLRKGLALVVACSAATLAIPAAADLASLMARKPPPAFSAPSHAPTPQDVEKGRELYQERCSLCHGADGKGHGPASRGMRPRPIALNDLEHMGRVSDAQLFWAIHQGSPGSAMPAWASTMADQDIWNVVAFIRSLSVPADAGTPGSGEKSDVPTNDMQDSGPDAVQATKGGDEK